MLSYFNIRVQIVKKRHCLKMSFSSVKICDYEIVDHVVTQVKNVVGQKRRRKYYKKFRVSLSESQDNKCYWCYRDFGMYFKKDGFLKMLTMQIDHVKPYLMEGRNEDDNLVGACSRCNVYKSSSYFSNEDDMRQHLIDKWNSDIKKNKIEVIDETEQEE